jgi:hypothetical protein
MRVLLAIAAFFAALLSPTSVAEPNSDPGRAAADRLVAAMGGAEVWSKARGLSIRAKHWETENAAPYDNLILMSLDEPKMRFEAESATIKRHRAIVDGKGWRVSEIRPVGPMTAEQVADDLRWWEAHAYRNIGRLAEKDPELTPKLAADGRLELYRPDGVRLVWYRLNVAGEPIAYGAWDNNAGTVIGPLAEREGGVKLPMWVASASGDFRVNIVEAAALPTSPPADYDKP